MPSVTNTKDVLPFLTIVSAGRVVTTKTRAWKVGSSPRTNAEVRHATADDERADAGDMIGLEALGLAW